MKRWKYDKLLSFFVMLIPLCYIFANQVILPELKTVFLIPLNIVLVRQLKDVHLNFSLNGSFSTVVKPLFYKSIRLIVLYAIIFFTIQNLYLDHLIQGKQTFDLYSQKAIWIWEVNIFSLEVSAYIVPIILIFNFLLWYAISQIAFLLICLFSKISLSYLRWYFKFNYCTALLLKFSFYINCLVMRFVFYERLIVCIRKVKLAKLLLLNIIANIPPYTFLEH